MATHAPKSLGGMCGNAEYQEALKRQRCTSEQRRGRIMMKSCVVFSCSNRAGKKGCENLSFYRLPVKNKKLLRAWLGRMRTESVRVNSNSRVCSAHFEGGKKSDASDVPSIFPWTIKSKRKAPAQRNGQSDSLLLSEASHSSCSEPPSTADAESKDENDVHGNNLDISNLAIDPAEVLNSKPASGVSIPCVDDNESLKGRLRGSVVCARELQRELDSVQLQLEAAKCRANLLELELEKEKKNSCECRSGSESRFSFVHVQHSNDLVRFYTGLPNVAMFEALYAFVEDCVGELVTWSDRVRSRAEPTPNLKKSHALQPRDQLFLTLMKLRLNCPYVDLAMRFGISTYSNYI